MKQLIISVIGSIAIVSNINAHCGKCSTEGSKEDHGKELACSSEQLEPYFGAQTALAGDDLVAAQVASSKLIALANEKGCSLDGESCCSAEIEAASAISEAKNIADARDAFKDWSNALIGKLDSGHSNEGELYKMHCPMAFGNQGGSWLQSNKDLRNPYYGAMMLKCGMIQQEYRSGENSPVSSEHKHH